MAYFAPRAMPSTPHNTPITASTSTHGFMTVEEARALLAATFRPPFNRPKGYFLAEDFSLKAPPPPPRNYGPKYEQFVVENAGHFTKCRPSFGMLAPAPPNYDHLYEQILHDNAMCRTPPRREPKVGHTGEQLF
ncbi:hypothetical protein C8R43DRAFT_956322 [Mycena crocata]|nr:hypothetical protein C8R43DRAFT_956322 [Mycena crocata]